MSSSRSGRTVVNKRGVTRYAVVGIAATWVLFISADIVVTASSPESIDPDLAANGITSDDVALAKAAAACNSRGGRLILPAGRILLTGAATIVLNPRLPETHRSRRTAPEKA
jgi:hypothetical protein